MSPAARVLTLAALATVLAIVVPGRAHARGAGKYAGEGGGPEADGAGKPVPADPKARARHDRQLRARIGKPPPPVINVVNRRTRETLVLDARKGATVPQAVADRFFRCHFTNEPPKNYDLRLIGVLVAAALHFKSERIEIVSGFRAPKYNLSLRKKGREVARDSQHTYGHAVDFFVPGVATTTVRDWLRRLRLGGVGYYPESGFVHADVGKVRYWTGR